MQDTLEKVKDTIVDETTSILDHKFVLSDDISITVKGLIFVVVALIITSFILKLVRRFTTRKMSLNDKQKFVTVFGYIRWFVFLIIFLVAMNASGVNVTAVFAASAALLIGVGLALQTLFQDILSGIFILVDQSVHAGDIIELEGKIGRVLDIRLRTTRAVTIDNRVLVIPNHLYLTNILFNWTENGTETREYVDVGVAYGSDVELVRELLIDIAQKNDKILKIPEPGVLFTDFADSSLNFRLAFSLNDSFEARFVKSDLRFAIDKAFRENNVTIPFPQRDVHVFTNAKPGIQFEKIENTTKE
ncbi:mechanosensitive ion channel protein MscS [Polaribacter vadi]|jgi:small-conductance mechanosensitive channel|uniref:Mechanosensitive ion channel protein MscS n=1 Tax=Polaribacter vadi TaxID=1774273 RepID=A0A1B8TWW3_9FLAO|nr:mechanosensitive ion channel domain-containing protein [Polaribacter vadi]AOW16950.1 mechanosensitive ion channel protein MscS [Polaribacter vadi]OBY64143.1 mechanosensitive ion channel protein MscS [Polaribacter vadi]|tara:strand:+ start:702 stop:1610 length:909 start_codon:yes stop_codon:yes gene_type:complete